MNSYHRLNGFFLCCNNLLVIILCVLLLTMFTQIKYFSVNEKNFLKEKFMLHFEHFKKMNENTNIVENAFAFCF